MEKHNPFVDKRWPGKLRRKIDVFVGVEYKYSTCAYRTLRDAKLGYIFRYGKPDKKLTAKYAKEE